MNWQLWLKGLISAVISGVATSVTMAIVDPNTFNLQEGFNRLATLCAVSGIVSTANYLKKSPLPDTLESPLPGDTVK